MATVKLGTDKIAIIYTVLAGAGFAAPLVFLVSESREHAIQDC